MQYTEQEPNTSSRVLVYIAAVIVLLLAIFGVYPYNKGTVPEIVPVEKVDIANVKTGLNATGFKVSNQEAGAIVDKIEHQVATKAPDFKTTVNDEKTADSIIKQVAKNDKADVVIKEEKDKPATNNNANSTNTGSTQKDIYYYGIHMEKHNAIGVYTDLYKEGSYGIHARRDKTVVEVGRAYNGGDIRARVAYEALQF